MKTDKDLVFYVHVDEIIVVGWKKSMGKMN